VGDKFVGGASEKNDTTLSLYVGRPTWNWCKYGASISTYLLIQMLPWCPLHNHGHGSPYPLHRCLNISHICRFLVSLHDTTHWPSLRWCSTFSKAPRSEEAYCSAVNLQNHHMNSVFTHCRCTVCGTETVEISTKCSIFLHHLLCCIPIHYAHQCKFQQQNCRISLFLNVQ